MQTVNHVFRWMLPAFLLVPLPVYGQRYHAYVGSIGPHSVVLAWGTADGPGNTIGRGSQSHGAAEIRFGSQTLLSQQNWIGIEGLQPDTEYPYQIRLNGREIGAGNVRTYPLQPKQLAFLVIGDWGTGTVAQHRLADVMFREFEKRKGTDNPVRFVLTTGDNIYGDRVLWAFRRRTGDEDRHWKTKFFEPYEPLLQHIPFYPSLGNHDGNSSESRGDLPVYLDNFFFAGNAPARYYRFSLGTLVEFFALDSTENTLEGSPAPAYAEGGPQYRWLQEALANSPAVWKIPYFHHAPWTAGPRHDAMRDKLRPFLELFPQHGVRVVFSGHEHNFQFSEQSPRTGGVLYVVTGAGGELRKGDVRKDMPSAGIAGWAPQHHFLLVEIAHESLTITPLGYEPILVRDPQGAPVPMPIRVRLRTKANGVGQP